jgi:CheY-like chemotaxis protein
MTASAYREDIERALSSDMNGHLVKPVNIDDVMRTLADVPLA